MFVEDDGGVLSNVVAKQELTEAVFHVVLDGSLQRAGTKLYIVALGGDILLGCVGQLTGELLVISGDKRLMVINYELGRIINEYISNSEIYCLCHSNDGKIFLGCNKGEVKILNNKFQNITTLKIHNDVVSSMKLFKNQILCTSSWDGSFALSV